MRRTVNGVEGEGLRTTVLPVKRAGKTFEKDRNTGAFHGLIAHTTPRGIYCVTTLPMTGDSLVVSGRSIARKDGPKKCVMPPISHREPANGRPCSAVERALNSSVCFAISSRHAARDAFRSRRDVALHP